MTSDKKIALLGTMDTNWRAMVADRLQGECDILDNTDMRWRSADSVEDMEPLIARDLIMMHDADVVLWHHDIGEGRTARIELGYLAAISDSEGIDSVVYVDPGVASHTYMEALVMHHPRMHWAQNWEMALKKVRDLLVG